MCFTHEHITNVGYYVLDGYAIPTKHFIEILHP